MAATRLRARSVERLWGRTDLPPELRNGTPAGVPVGEIWLEDSRADADLLVKYLLTSERLSIQVHPDDDRARSLGLASGKDEAWFVLEAEPGATIGLGLKENVSRARLREAALDGSIEGLVDWRPVRPGDFFYSPAGTVHAIGAGISLIEVQQNADITYRLYDYGRPRALHLDEAVAAARAERWTAPCQPEELSPGRRLLGAGRFVVEHWRLEGEFTLHAQTAVQLVPLAGNWRFDGAAAAPGSAWRADGEAALQASEGAELLAAYCGEIRKDLLRAV